MVFLRDQTFFDYQLKCTFFSDLIKSKQFFPSGRTQNNFSPFIYFYFLHTILSSWKLLCGICRIELNLPK